MKNLKNKNKETYNLSLEEALLRTVSRREGLTRKEVEERQAKWGRNGIVRRTSWKWPRIILGQFNDALVWILLVAAALAFFFHEMRDVSIILIIVLVNAAIGFSQEFKAERILEGIRKLTRDRAIVIRDGEKKEIDTAEIVPGDIVAVSAGDYVPADGYLLESYDLRVNSFVFTGESKPKSKKSGVHPESGLTLGEITNLVFWGETVATGEAKFVVTETGMRSELGKLAQLTSSVKDETTPLQKQMRILGKDVTILALLIGALVIIAGQYFRMSLYQNFLFALALSVSVVPEGLPAAISVALSLGMKRLLKDNVLVKKLSAVETLGSVAIICTDKTGTITRNELTVTRVRVNGETFEVSGIGYEPHGRFLSNGTKIIPQAIPELEMLFRIGTLCNDASLVRDGKKYKILGDPTEGAILVAARKFEGEEKYFFRSEKKLDENPFSSDRMMMSVIYRNRKTQSLVKGSPDVILERCAWKIEGGRIARFTAKEKEAEQRAYNQMSGEALRVLAFAFRDLDGISSERYAAEAEKNLVWVGMMAMIDPPRQDVKEAIQECKSLGIKPIMITGDYEITARAIAQSVGLIGQEKEFAVISGRELNNLKDKEVFRIVQQKDVVFARITPEQKLRIASILKDHGQVIAMTGDGVNDAPAIKKADIGIAMGIMGTDVSKEAADMILLDDNFASIVKGVREGRTIYQNLRKFVHYVFTSNASELFTVILGVLLHIPSPISAVQILAIDLGTDIFPSFSLGLEPAEPKSLSHRRADLRSGVMSWKGFRRIIYLGIIMATGAVIAFLWSMVRGGWNFGQALSADSLLYIKSTTAAYAVLSMTQMANLIQSRSEKLSPFELGFFRNPYVFGAIAMSIGMLLLFMYLPFFQQYLRMIPIDGKDWLVVVVSVIVVFLFEEARKTEEK